MRRSFHTIARPAASAIAAEEPVLVYESKEAARKFDNYLSNLNVCCCIIIELKEATQEGWDRQLSVSPHKAKVYSLIPFLCEAALTQKHFVLKMELFPNASLLKLQVLRWEGVKDVYVPIDQVIPITKYDYWGASWKLWFKQH